MKASIKVQSALFSWSRGRSVANVHSARFPLEMRVPTSVLLERILLWQNKASPAGQTISARTDKGALVPHAAVRGLPWAQRHGVGDAATASQLARGRVVPLL